MGIRLCNRGWSIHALMQKQFVFSKALRGLQLLPRSYSIGTVASGFTEEELQRLKSSARKAGSQFHPPEVSLREGVKPSDKRPVALLVGWAASNLKVLSRYSTVYTKLGIPCLCVAPGILQIWSTKLGNTLTRNVLRVLDSSLNDPCSLVLHLCSGASTVTLPVLTEQHSDSSSVLQTKAPPVCVVFDSGPANFSYESGSAAAKLLYRQGGYNLLTYSIATSMGIITNVLIGSKKRSELSSALGSSLLDIPQLYLHSEADSVSPPSWVKAIAEKQIAKGRDVTSHCWPDSEHVRHYLQHPQQYENLVFSFLKKCNLLL